MPKLTVKLDFEDFPEIYTCKGSNRSPPIQVEGLLPDIKSLAILATTSPEEGPAKVAWVLWNLPPVSLIPEGFPGEEVVESPLPAVQGTNDFGSIGYRGPCPKPGEGEAYLFRVYALDIDLGLAPGATWEEMIRAVRGSLNQSGEAIAFAIR
ncbi:MAG TPA: YbhB/YbcL family Raf kinase inhibitor-like protein [Candidatus Methanoculleus thermohydrogenotrophicum]|jgi:Raf kinase inhibitor-like YbhB/YbcL family protein|nr:YbhB/YbcL family Raf kinase inhibitor-like protein [Candidatus Methanoculleus thermohydrogenotrophicum]HOB17276.1 YbhB/YbcL family Raf kinase inhibitor-like protein [Candidatus Methanoculleus thermohydrogenotrophicum]HQC90884.1 YbhB/YbcL family Raf kinase inhibitor-like protein [Candidatus Methanoculleus thermohydrogenotrophicum]